MNMVGGVSYVNAAQKYYAINPGSYVTSGTVSDYLETAASLTAPVKISAWIRSTGGNDEMFTAAEGTWIVLDLMASKSCLNVSVYVCASL